MPDRAQPTRILTAIQDPPTGDHAPVDNIRQGDLVAQQYIETVARRHVREASALTARLPLYQRIADDVRARIESGELADGSELPSEAAMVAQYGVSNKTVRAAIGALRASGMVVTEQGRRTKVRSMQQFSSTDVVRFDPRITRDGDEWSCWDDENWTLAHEPACYRDSAAQYSTPLGVKPAADVLIFQRQLVHTSGAQALHRLFVPLDIAANGLHDNPFKPPAQLYQALTAAGHLLQWRDTTTATMPSPDDAASLHIPDGVPLLIHIRVTLSDHLTPLALEETRLPADRAVISATLPIIE